jgi:hypothetical protein
MVEDNDISEDKKFEQLLDEKRHKELKSYFNKLISSISNDNKYEVMAKAFGKNTEAINRMVSVIQGLKVESPSVNVETNQDKVVGSLIEMSKQINSNLILLKDSIPKQETKKEDVKEWEFKVIRNYGNIEKVIAKAK